MFSSLKYRIGALVSISAIFITIIIIGYNGYILIIKDKDYFQSLENMLTLYCEEISTSLEQQETFLLENCMKEEDIQKITKPRNDIDLYLSIINMKSSFNECLNNYIMIDGLFIYDVNHDVFFVQTNDKSNEKIRNNASKFIEKFSQVSKTADNEWFWVNIDDTYYFTRMFVLHDVYVASFVKVTTIIESLQETVLGKTDFVVFCDRVGNILDERFEKYNLTLNQQDNILLENKSYRNLQIMDKSGNFSLAILNKKQQFFGNSEIVVKQVLFSFLIITCIGILSIYVIQKLFHGPINDLILAMNEIKTGNFDINMRKENVFDEFKVVNDTVESMAKEIKRLKIDVYEELLNKQRVELLYLQQQINPHFFINCMNLIRNLAIVEDHEKVKIVSVLVSKYIRYTLRSSSMISLEQELEHVDTYDRIQKIYYGNRLKIVYHVQDELLHSFVPTMIIQTFVDNSVKHQLDPENQLLISIMIKETSKMGGEKGLFIHIEDNGEGFNQQVLETLRKNIKIENDVGEHIGIYNVCQRIAILYNNKATINFFNANESGAIVEIFLPFNINAE